MNFFYINKLSTRKYPVIPKNYNFIILFKNYTFATKNSIKTINSILKKNINFNYQIVQDISLYTSKKPLGSRLGYGKGDLDLNINFYKKYSILVKFNTSDALLYKNIIKDISHKFKSKIFILKIKKC